jgi:CRISPR type III-associated protein (TIGR04423 family)
MNTPIFHSAMLSKDELTNKLKEFSNLLCEGFMRWSDSEDVIKINNSPLPTEVVKNTSFLYEANFYIEAQYSISIRQFNDSWLYNQTSWNIVPPKNDKLNDDFFIYNQYLNDGTSLKFYTQYVIEKCCNFDTLKPGWTAFIGFNKEDK